jgi:hypothetical protein
MLDEGKVSPEDIELVTVTDEPEVVCDRLLSAAHRQARRA